MRAFCDREIFGLKFALLLTNADFTVHRRQLTYMHIQTQCFKMHCGFLSEKMDLSLNVSSQSNLIKI